MGIEQIILIVGICLFTAVICKVMDSRASEYSVMLKLITAAVVFTSVIAAIVPAVKRICSLYSDTGISDNYIKILLKSLGICFLTQLASDICRDSGENALATQTEAAGKAALLVMAIPLLEQTAKLIYDIIY